MVRALLQLMTEKPYNEISIKEITEKADLSRRTFYRNFNQKDDLLCEYAHGLMEEYISDLREVAQPSAFNVMRVYFSFWKKHLDFLRLLEKNRLLYLVFEKHNEALPHIRKAVYGTECTDVPLQEYTIAFNAGGFCNLLFAWLRRGAQESPEKMAAFFVESKWL